MFIFDDSYDHEVWNEGNSTRILLIFDVWHPDISDEEIKFFDTLERQSYIDSIIRKIYDKGVDLEQ